MTFVSLFSVLKENDSEERQGFTKWNTCKDHFDKDYIAFIFEKAIQEIIFLGSMNWLYVWCHVCKFHMFLIQIQHCCIWPMQMTYMEEWSVVDKEHYSYLSGLIKALKASTLRLPVVNGARVWAFSPPISTTNHCWALLNIVDLLSPTRLTFRNFKIQLVRQSMCCRHW